MKNALMRLKALLGRRLYILFSVRPILRSGFFDRAYYIEQLQALGYNDWKIKFPLCHFLVWGGPEGLNPGPQFDSQWYLSVYVDVRSAGLNPLAHYVRQGCVEGRLPFLDAKPAFFTRLPKLEPSRLLSARLWGGFSHMAVPELERRARVLSEGWSAWYLAAWYYAQGGFGVAEDWLSHVDENKMSLRGIDKRLGLAKCYCLARTPSAIQTLLSKAGSSQAFGPNWPYVEANAITHDDAQKLGCINPVFERAGLKGLARRDPGLPLALSNLQAEDALPQREAGDSLPLISVVVSAYNAASSLSIALDGLLAQTWPALEIIVVDDASSDGTRDLIKAYAGRDGRIRYLFNERNLGAYPSRNRGMREARGDFVTVHDSDDWSHPQKLECQMQPLLEDERKVASYSRWVRVNESFQFLGSWQLGGGYLEVNQSSWLIRREVLETTGYWDSVNVEGDSEFALRMEHHFGHGALVAVLPSVPLAFALTGQDTLTRTKATHVRTIFYGLRRLYRESSRWWHRRSGGKPIMTERPFPIPLGNLKSPNTEFDRLVAANLAQEGQPLEALLDRLRDQFAQKDRVCLLHWPDYHAWPGNPIADEVFELCQREGVHFAHAGLTLSVPRVVLLEPPLWRCPPTQTVQIEGLQRVETATGEECEDEQGLINYFAQGGVDNGSQ
ncbi:glycosyltransferase family 2 protein [Marinimicrobium sp. C2-29]|uniref:glycosyltransferase family 2 protein n=1 Tax=Marinimicrobium sp. C2-29 TaxID=3139825 RepID=UPI00313A0E13